MHCLHLKFVVTLLLSNTIWISKRYWCLSSPRLWIPCVDFEVVESLRLIFRGFWLYELAFELPFRVAVSVQVSNEFYSKFFRRWPKQETYGVFTVNCVTDASFFIQWLMIWRSENLSRYWTGSCIEHPLFIVMRSPGPFKTPTFLVFPRKLI